MDLISEHFYCRDKPDLVAHVQQIPRDVRQKAEAHRDYRRRFESLKGKDIDIALDEWNYWYGPHVFGELGTRYFLKDALGIAAGLHEYARQSDIMFMANYAQTVNVIGCIKTTRTAAVIDSTGLALQLYRQHYGTVPVGVKAAEPLDVVAALTEDGKTLTIAIVNPTMARRVAADRGGASSPAAASAGESSQPTRWRTTRPASLPKCGSKNPRSRAASTDSPSPRAASRVALEPK